MKHDGLILSFDRFGEISVAVTSPTMIDSAEWMQYRGVMRSALIDALTEPSNPTTIARTPEEIDYLLRGDDLDAFARARIDPDVDIADGRLRAGQSFSNLVVGIARDTTELDDSGRLKQVASLNVADNVSGRNGLVRALKRRVPQTNYVHVREVAVDPEYQGRGIAARLLLMSIADKDPEQKLSAHIWEENDSMWRMAEGFGMRLVGTERGVQPFGAGTTPTDLKWYTAPIGEIEPKLQEAAIK